MADTFLISSPKETLTENNKNKDPWEAVLAPNKDKPAWYAMGNKSLLMAQIQELLAQIEAMQQSGGEYPLFYIINVVMAKLNIMSDELKETIAKPLEHYQEISKHQSIVEQRIEAIKRKQLAGEKLTKEDVEELKGAIKDMENAVEKLKEAYTFEDNDGNPIVIWPSEEIEDIYNKAKANARMMQTEGIRMPSGEIPLEDIDLDDPSQLEHALRAITIWAQQANAEKPTGPFVDWEGGKGSAPGNATMRIILDAEISTFTDKLNRGTTIIQSFQSMGQKQVELAHSLMRGIVANFISR